MRIESKLADVSKFEGVSQCEFSVKLNLAGRELCGQRCARFDSDQRSEPSSERATQLRTPWLRRNWKLSPHHSGQPNNFRPTSTPTSKQPLEASFPHTWTPRLEPNVV